MSVLVTGRLIDVKEVPASEELRVFVDGQAYDVFPGDQEKGTDEDLWYTEVNGEIHGGWRTAPACIEACFAEDPNLDPEPDLYVESVEMRTVGGSGIENGWAILHCQDGDTYQAFFEEGGWWIQVFAGDPSDGPFESVDDVVDFLNNPL